MISLINLFNGMLWANSSILIQESDKVPEPQELGPVLEPDPVAFSFQAPGWYFLGILVFLVFFYSLFRWIKKYRSNTYRREALRKVLELNDRDSEEDLSRQVLAVMTILKNVALKRYGRNTAATLYGNSWLKFLESKSKNTQFSQLEPMISRTIYENRPPNKNELNKLKNLSIKWIKTHA